MILSPDDVVTRLVRVAPPFFAKLPLTPTRCIYVTRIGLAVLDRFGIEAEAWPVTLKVANRAWMDWFGNGLEPGLTPDELVAERDRRGAWEVVVGAKDQPWETRQGKGWNGHLVVYVPMLQQVVDLDVQAVSRPAKAIVVPGAWHLPWTSLVPRMGADNGVIGVLYERWPENIYYKTSKDWQRPAAPVLVDALAHLVRHAGGDDDASGT